MRRWLPPIVALTLGAACATGATGCKAPLPAPEKIADPAADVLDAAADGTHVYFLLWKNPRATIARLPLSGGTLETLGEDDEAPRHLALTGDAVYWTTESNLKRMPKSGGKPALFAAGVDGRIAVDERDLYSFERKPSGQERLVARALAGPGSVTRVVTEDAHGGAFIAVDASAVYVTRAIGGGNVERVPKTGGKPTVLATARIGGPLLLLGDDVYYCDAALYRVGKQGGTPRRISASCGERLVSIDGVVFSSTESQSSGVGAYAVGSVSALVDGAAPRVLFEGTGARALVAANSALYFAGRTAKKPEPAWVRVRTR